MISYLEALELLEQNAKDSAILFTESIRVLDSLERISASDICSPVALPSFDNSAMDGFALRYEDTINASQESPVMLLITDILSADTTIPKIACSGLVCNEIMTGAAVPSGFDAVVQVELVEEVDLDGLRYIKITTPIIKHANIRFCGEDVCASSSILRLGQQITACDIMLLSAVGLDTIEVFKPLTISIASSGNEVSDGYGADLNYGEIYNSNSPLLLNLAKAKCFTAHYVGILRDESKSLYDFINQSTEQILITTGAVSKGKWDFIPQTLLQMGARIIFHGVAIRPGKPILFARLKDGRYFFGLPGNPVSTFVGWRFFITPFIYKMWGNESEALMKVELATPFKKTHKLRQFLKAKLKIDNGKALATISLDQESFKIKPLTDNNIWAIITESQHEMEIGDLVIAAPLYFQTLLIK